MQITRRTMIGLIAAVCVLLLAAAPARAKQAWEFQTYFVDATGVTIYGEAGTGVTVSTSSSQDPFAAAGPSGVSAMVRRHGPTPTDPTAKHDPFTAEIRGTSGVFAAEIIAMEPTLLNSTYAFATGTTDYSSGTTGTWFVRMAPYNTPAVWGTAPRLAVIHSPAMNSGVTRDWVVFRADPGAAFMRVEYCPSGITPVNTAPLRIHEMSPDTETSLIMWAEQSTAVGTSGTTPAATSGTPFTLPDGATWFGFFANGDDVPYSTDGTAPATSGRLFIADYETFLGRREARDLGLGGTGGAAATLKMTPYRERPY